MTDERDAERLRAWLDGDRTQAVDDATADVVGLFRSARGEAAPDPWDRIETPRDVAPPPSRRSYWWLGLAAAALALVVWTWPTSEGDTGAESVPGPSSAEREAALTALVTPGPAPERLQALNRAAASERRRLVAAVLP